MKKLIIKVVVLMTVISGCSTTPTTTSANVETQRPSSSANIVTQEPTASTNVKTQEPTASKKQKIIVLCLMVVEVPDCIAEAQRALRDGSLVIRNENDFYVIKKDGVWQKLSEQNSVPEGVVVECGEENSDVFLNAEKCWEKIQENQVHSPSE
jgi:hypothetical protein